MDKRFYIMIMGNCGKVRRFPCSKKKIYLLCTTALCLTTLFAVSFTSSLSLFNKNKELNQQLVRLEKRIKYSETALAENKQLTDKERKELHSRITALKLDSAKQAKLHREERERLLSTTVSELKERSELIGAIFESIGIEVASLQKKSHANSGGPYIPAKTEVHDELLYKADAYLATIRHLPLGQPITGPITSGFGKRIDPINKKRSFHEGVDIKGKLGEKIYAPADGVVTRAFKNAGFGNYVEIDHGHGYTTAYGHLQGYAVTRGDQVTRGQLIGQVGNTGRTTGPHLHYEIRYKKKPINPKNYLQIAQLLKKQTTSYNKKHIKVTRPFKKKKTVSAKKE